MKINEFELYFNEDRVPTLVREKKVEYSEYIKRPLALDKAMKIAELMNSCYNYKNQVVEKAYIIVCSTRLKPVAIFQVGTGTDSFCIQSIRNILTRVLLTGHRSFMFTHNHPSGVAEPSMEDKLFTRNLIKASNIVDLKFLDHIIVGDGYYSFAENGEDVLMMSKNIIDMGIEFELFDTELKKKEVSSVLASTSRLLDEYELRTFYTVIILRAQLEFAFRYMLDMNYEYNRTELVIDCIFNQITHILKDMRGFKVDMIKKIIKIEESTLFYGNINLI